MLRKILSFLGGDGFGNPSFKAILLLKHFCIQKMLRINHLAGWPVHWTSKVISPEKIERGTRCPGLSMGCHIDGRNGINFGKNVWIGPRVSIISMNHNPNNYHHYIEGGPVIIGDNCWLGANAVILPEVKIGEHTIVAAGSVVTKSFPDSNQLLAGVPAKVVKKLDDYKG
ncbi:acyltransferase [Halomonas cibimaris]